MRLHFLIGPITLVPLAMAQTPMHTVSGGASHEALGWELGALGDVNGDGFPDLVAQSRWDPTGTGHGSVRGISGVDGSVLYTVYGPPNLTSNNTMSVAGIGDVNADGIGDFAFASPSDLTTLPSGSVSVYSGVDGSKLYTRFNVNGTGEYGRHVSGAGDINGDGIPDVITGTKVDHTTGPHRGMAEVFSGLDGTILYTWFGSQDTGYFGSAVGAAGDVNNDGRDDVIVGAAAEGGNGRAYVYSGLDGSILHTLVPTSGWEFGGAVDGLGDVDNDGHDDVAVAAPYSRFVQVFSGATGGLLYELAAPLGWRFGASIDGKGDLNADGYRDLLVSSPTQELIRAYSGVDGAPLFVVSVPGLTVAKGVIFTGPIVGTSVVGFAGGGTRTPPGNGAVHQFATECFWRPYCVTSPNSVGPGATVSISGSLSISTNSTRLQASGCPPNVSAIFIYSRKRAFLPLSDGTRCVGGHIYRLHVVNTGPNGTPSRLLDFNNMPGLGGTISIGEGYRFQCWYRDQAAGGTGANLSNALEAWFCE